MKNILYLLLFMGTIQLANAQDRKFHLLISVGANASQVNGDKLAGFDKFGLNVGAGVRRSFGVKSAWQLEFLYSEKGSKDVVSTNNPVPDTLFKFNYIDIPLVYTYNFYPKLRAEIGVFNSVRLSATYSDFVIDYDRNTIIRSSDHGLLAGAQYQFGEHLGLNLRISQSILDINASIERYYNLYTSFSIRYTL